LDGPNVNHVLPVVAGCCLLLSLLPSRGHGVLQDQSSVPPGSIHGRIVEQSGSKPLANVEVRLLPPGLSEQSNNGGWFTFADLDPGAYILRVETTHGVRMDSVHVVPGGVLDITIPIPTEPIPLDPIEVTVSSSFLDRIGFFDRRMTEGGYYLTSGDIEAMHAQEFTDVAKRLPSVLTLSMGIGSRMVLFRRPYGAQIGGQGCEPALYLDGVRVRHQLDRPYNPDFNIASPGELAAVEIYVGALTPLQYRVDSCGAILLWTKR
jgi:hypothetical protein